jgi:hypothetical protein
MRLIVQGQFQEIYSSCKYSPVSGNLFLAVPLARMGSLDLFITVVFHCEHSL